MPDPVIDLAIQDPSSLPSTQRKEEINHKERRKTERRRILEDYQSSLTGVVLCLITGFAPFTQSTTSIARAGRSRWKLKDARGEEMDVGRRENTRGGSGGVVINLH